MSARSQQTIRHARIRKRVVGTTERPRLSVHFTGQHIYAQVIDDTDGRTLVAVQTTEKGIKSGTKVRPNIGGAEKVGKLVAERSLTKNIKKVVFDRGGLLYHGKVKALADAARTGGLDF